jgi:peroxiredoxin
MHRLNNLNRFHLEDASVKKSYATYAICFLGCAIFGWMVASVAKAGEAGQAIAKEIAVGERAPAFSLKDQNDQEFSLETMIKKGPVAVVFIRSVDWCSYCQLQTVQLSDRFADIRATGGQVVVVCYDPPEKVKRFTARRKLVVPILADADSQTIDAYAMRAIRGVGDQIGSAQHGTFVIDQAGIVRSKPYLTSFDGDAAVEMLIHALKDASKPKS